MVIAHLGVGLRSLRPTAVLLAAGPTSQRFHADGMDVMPIHHHGRDGLAERRAWLPPGWGFSGDPLTAADAAAAEQAYLGHVRFERRQLDAFVNLARGLRCPGESRLALRAGRQPGIDHPVGIRMQRPATPGRLVRGGRTSPPARLLLLTLGRGVGGLWDPSGDRAVLPTRRCVRPAWRSVRAPRQAAPATPGSARPSRRGSARLGRAIGSPGPCNRRGRDRVKWNLKLTGGSVANTTAVGHGERRLTQVRKHRGHATPGETTECHSISAIFWKQYRKCHRSLSVIENATSKGTPFRTR